MIVPKSANLIRAVGVTLMLYGALLLLGAVTQPISELLHPSGLGRWVLVGGIICVLEAGAIVLAGIILLSRSDHLVLAGVVWFAGSFVKSAFYFWRATAWDATLENFGSLISLLAPALGLMVLVVLLSQLQKTETKSANCLKCNYSLRGLTEPRCPECGRVYTLDEFYNL